MITQCKHPACDSKTRMLTADEIRNLNDFNLTRSAAQEIFMGTVTHSLCAFHAAAAIEPPIDSYILDQLKDFDPCAKTNFLDAGRHAICAGCGGLLLSLRANQNGAGDFKRTLTALNVPESMIEPLAWVSHTCVSFGHGRCVSCTLKDENLMSDNAAGKWERNELREYLDIIKVTGEPRLKYGRFYREYISDRRS